MRAVLLVPLLACSTYAQHQAAFVPRATPMPTDGQPLQGTGELALGASNLGELVKPSAGDPDTGVAVPGVQLRGSLALRVGTNGSVYGVFEDGLAATAIPVKSSEPPINQGDVRGYGLGWTYSATTSTPGLRIALANELVFWSAPWIQYTSCVSNCTVPGATTIATGSSTVPTFVFAVVPSYRTGRVTVFGGATMRNHPTIVDKLETNLPSDPDVQMGPINLLLHAGIAIELGAGIRASAIVNQNIAENPVRYGPGGSVMVAIPFGRDARRTP